MRDWLGYTLQDFVMFGPEVYWRLFSLQNQALWPLPIVAVMAGVALLVLVGSVKRPMRPVIGLAIALGWAGATDFLATRYAPINWPLEHAVWVFGAQAVLGAVSAVPGVGPSSRPARGTAWRIGLLLLAYSVLLHPLVGLGFGRPLAQAEVAGLAPDPTALASLGLVLLMGPGWRRVALSIVPVAWSVVSAVTLLALGEAQGWILVGALGVWTAGLLAETPLRAHRKRPEQGPE